MDGFFYYLGKKIMPMFVRRFLVLSWRKSLGIRSRLSLSMPRRRQLFSVRPENVVEVVAEEAVCTEEQILSLEGLLQSRKLEVDVVDLHSLPYSNAHNLLLFVESAAAKLDYHFLVNLAVEGRYFIVFRAKKDYLEFLENLAASGFEVETFFGRVLYIPTIDPELDELVYLQSDEFSSNLIGCMEKSFETAALYAEYSRYLRSMEVGISDRFVGWARSYAFVLKFISEHEIHGFYVFGNRLIDNNLIAFAVRELKNIPCAVVRFWNAKAFKATSSIRITSCISRDWVPSDRLTGTRYNIACDCVPGDDILLFFGNLRDPMYRGTLQPVLEHFSTKVQTKMFVLLPYADDMQSEAGSAVDAFKYVLPSVQRDDLPEVEVFNECFDHGLSEFLFSEFSRDSQRGLLALYVALNARKSIHRVLRDCHGLMREVNEVSSKARIAALISNPGRLWPSQFIVGYLSNIPSFDIQSGTFSRSSRYKKPGSSYVLAVDDFSKSVYVDYLGVDKLNVEVVGAPRIDARLADIRNYTQGQSRSLISVCGEGYKILCLATQPYDIKLMTSMVDEACKFISINDDWFLLVSMHPNENDAFSNSYSSVLRDLSKLGRALISRGNIYHNLNASDAVVTYFSTAGLEAFCLDKPVFAYKAHGYPPVPFDLCELGVAKPFADCFELETALCDSERPGAISEGLIRLKDGRSVERICDFILNKINRN